MSERIIIVGGVAAGTSVAAKAKRTRPDLEIVLYQREDFVAYSACGLPYLIAGDVASHEALIARTPAQFAQQGIDVRVGHEVVAVDGAAGKVTVRDRDGNRTFDDHYDHLVIATGAQPLVPPVEGIDLPGVFQLRSLADGLAVNAYLADERPRTAVVVGGGYIGVEMAEAFVARGLKVALLDMAPQVLRTLDAEIARLVEAHMAAAGVELLLGSSMEALNAKSDGRVCCLASDGRKIDGEIVLLATGVKPSTQLALALGAQCGPRDAILVDGLGRTSVERVYAAGDCATVQHQVLGMPAYIPLGTTANKQGRTLGAFLGGVERLFAGVVGSAVTKFQDMHVGSTGLSEADAKLQGYAVKAVTIQSTDHAGYYPNARPITVKLVADAATDRLLGGQIVGFDDVAKRIDVIALGLAQQMTADAFAWSDLTYAPPFSSVWDPLLVAAQKLAGDR